MNDEGRRLIADLGELWPIAIDLLTFYRSTCQMCQPRDSEEEDGVFWLLSNLDIAEEMSEIVYDVCEVHSHPIDRDVDLSTIRQAIDESSIRCPDCDHELTSMIDVSKAWWAAPGNSISDASYLLRRNSWPYITHYTKPNGSLNALQVMMSITEDGVIRAIEYKIKQKRRVVCFTECSPFEIAELQKAEKTMDHARLAALGPVNVNDKYKWARDPFGIAMRRSEAIKAGARPVIHGDDNLLTHLPEHERFRFVTIDHTKSNSDWTFEREFRFEGDLYLG